MGISLLQEGEGFLAFLNRKKLAFETIKKYLFYLDKLIYILNESGVGLEQRVIDYFQDIYPHRVARAFLFNYIEFKKRKHDLTLTKVTGRPIQKERETIPPHHLELIREKLYLHDERYGLIFDLSINCALRRQEVISIKAQDLLIEKEDSMFIIIRKAKGNKERKVFVPKDIAILVIHYCLNRKLTPDKYLFESKTTPNKALDLSRWNKVFSSASYDATGKKYHPHQLRYTRATQWFEKGVDIVRIKQRLGHADISTTNLYINPDELKELERWSQEE